MPVCSFCGLPTEPLPYHGWAVHCLDALKAARAQDAAKLAAADLLAEHYEALEAEVDRLEAGNAELLSQRDTARAVAESRRREIAALQVRLAQAEAGVERGG